MRILRQVSIDWLSCSVWLSIACQTWAMLTIAEKNKLEATYYKSCLIAQGDFRQNYVCWSSLITQPNMSNKVLSRFETNWTKLRSNTFAQWICHRFLIYKGIPLEKCRLNWKLITINGCHKNTLLRRAKLLEVRYGTK